MATLTPATDEPLLNKDHLEVLATLSDDNPKELIEDLYNTFKADYPKLFEFLQKSAASQDTTELRRAVHKLNGSAANLGFNRLSMLCREAEGQILDNKFTAFDTIVDSVSNLYNETIEKFEDYLKSL